MANEYFKGTDLRSYFHSFGRAFTAQGQNFLDQAPLKSGHTVTTADVRAQEVPYVDADFKLEKAFTTDNGTVIAAETSILTGTYNAAAGTKRQVIAELADVLDFYDHVELQVMTGTNGQSYQLIVDGKVITGFIDPTDAFDSTGKKTAAGYIIKVVNSKDEPIPMSAGWVVDPVNGAVTFEKGKTPTDKSYGTIKIIAFAYKGKKVSDKIKQLEDIFVNGDIVSDVTTLKTDVTTLKTKDDELQTAINNIDEKLNGFEANGVQSVAIQPITFMLSDMNSVEIKDVDDSSSVIGYDYSITLNGFVMNVLDEKGTLIGETKASETINGATVVMFKNIDIETKTEISDETFTAYALVNKDGTVISVEKSISFKDKSNSNSNAQ